MESIGTEENLCVTPEGEEETESLDGEDPETWGGIGGADQVIGYIIHFAIAVELYQKKNWNCLGCGSPDHLVKDCSKDLSKTTRKVSLNVKEGMAKKGGWVPHKPVVSELASLDEVSNAWRHPKKFPSWTPTHSIGGADPENIAWLWIDGENSWALLDSGSTINVVTLELHWGLFIGCWSLEQLVWWYPGYKWFWKSILPALGLCCAQGEGVCGYDVDQVGLVIPDSTGFGTSYSGYAHYQLDHQCEGKWNWWVVSFPEWIKESPIASLSASRTFDS